MKIEILNRYTNAVIFAIDADSKRAAVEAAVRSRADLSWADLSWADLSGANLSWADLSGADLSGANLSGANLSGAEGLNKNRVTPLRILLEQPGPIRAYKLVNSLGEGPFNGGINYCDPNTDTFSVENLNSDDSVQCGTGINLATLDWVMKEWKPGYRILIMEFFANEPKGNLVIPTATDGKFRVGACRRVGEKDLKELGLERLARLK
jgi:pentapeptide repeat protein